MNTKERVYRVIDEQVCGISPATPLEDTMQLARDLKLDSLDAIELSMELESEFDIHFNDDELERVKDITVGDIVKLVDAQIAKERKGDTSIVGTEQRIAALEARIAQQDKDLREYAKELDELRAAIAKLARKSNAESLDHAVFGLAMNDVEEF